MFRWYVDTPQLLFFSLGTGVLDVGKFIALSLLFTHLNCFVFLLSSWIIIEHSNMFQGMD